MYRKSCCTTPGVGVGIRVDVSVRKMLEVIHRSFLCDGQGADRRAILYMDRARLFKTNDNVS